MIDEHEEGACKADRAMYHKLSMGKITMTAL